MNKHCRHVKGTSPFDITVTSGRLRGDRNQSHTCAPCKKEGKRKKDRFYIYSDGTHTQRKTQKTKKSTVSMSGWDIGLDFVVFNIG